MTLIKDITTKDWSLSSAVQGEVVTGINDLKQCVFNILMTVPGSDPLRPTFGCYVFQYLGKPTNKVVPQMMKKITEAIALYEPRVEVTEITAEINLSNVLFNISMDSVLGEFELKVNYGKDPYSIEQGNYIVTEVGDYLIDENDNYIIHG